MVPEQLDAVGLTAEHAFTRRSARFESTRSGCRRRGGGAAASGRRRLPQPDLPPSSAGGERASRGASSSSCAAVRGGRQSGRAAATASGAPRSVRSPSPPRAALSNHITAQTARAARRGPRTPRAQPDRAQRTLPRASEAAASVSAVATPARPERLGSSGLSSPSPRNDCGARNRDDDRLRRRPGLITAPARRSLGYMVRVVLEPEDDVDTVAGARMARFASLGEGG